MKRLITLTVLVLTAILLVAVSCAQTPVSSPTPAPAPVPSPSPPPVSVPPEVPGASDDIVTPPGGFTYRANVHQEGQPDWLPIQEAEVSLQSLFGTINIKYRDYIETRAGETRNNIIYLDARNSPNLDPLDVDYYTVDPPDGITFGESWHLYGGIGGQDKKSSKTLQRINIAQEVAPGEYPFTIRLSFEGRELGSVPCTVKVLE